MLMRKINIGQDYAIDITSDLRNLPTPWVLNTKSKLHPQYVVWGDLDGEMVTVVGKTKLLTDYARVVLKKGPKEDFTIPQSCLLEVTTRLPVVCCCEIRKLMSCGCKCGAFQREKRQLLNLK